MRPIQITAFVLFLLLSNGVKGKRSDKPYRWKKSMKEHKNGGIKRRDIEKTLVFTYTRKYNRECDCLKSLPTHVKFVHPEEMNSHQLLSRSDWEQLKENSGELSKNEEKKSILQLGLFLGSVSKRGAFLVVNELNHTICDDYFGDRTAVALCQLNGFRTGYRATRSASNCYHDSGKHSDEESSKAGGSNFDMELDRYKCFAKLYAGYRPYHGTGKQVLNLTTTDQCTVQKNSANDMPCSLNQAAAVFCHDNTGPYLQFYDMKLRTGALRFYITFQVRYVKNGRISEYFQDSLKSLKVMPRRPDFSASMCGEKVGIDFHATKDMGHGKHLTILGSFIKKCDECVRILFKNIPIIDDDLKICRQIEKKNSNVEDDGQLKGRVHSGHLSENYSSENVVLFGDVVDMSQKHRWG